MATRFRYPRRRGNVLILTLLMMVGMLAVLALAVDVGYLQVVRAQLQRSADSAALAAAWDLIDQNAPTGTANEWLTASARNTASQYAGFNAVLNQNLLLAEEDVQIGHLANPSDPAETMSFFNLQPANAVRVRVRRTADQNGDVPLFFARALGIDRAASYAEATAALLNNVSGFRAPSDGGNLHLLPYALDEETWIALQLDAAAGTGSDQWRWDPDLEQVVPGSDQIPEVNLYPQAIGSPGNRGTVNIGTYNNSTNTVRRQIVHGLTTEDLDFHGGTLELDANGELLLTGNTGISAAVKSDLEAIKGQTRILPIFREVHGPGNNAEYTIVQFVGVRILDVKLTGKMTSKRVIVQPANVFSRGGIPAPNTTPTSHFVYSPVWLVR